MRAGIAGAVRAGADLRALGPAALVSFLAAAAFAPFLSPFIGHLAGGTLEAEIGTALGQLGGVGGGYLAELLSRTAERMRARGRSSGDPATQELIREDLDEAFRQALGAAVGEASSGLREEISAVLRRVDAVQAALAADTASSLAEGFTRLGEELAEFRWVLDDVRAMLARLLRTLEDSAAQQRSEWRSVHASQGTVISLLLRVEGLLRSERDGAGPAGETAGAAAPVCPYPGLLPFGSEDARWFFGREELTLHLVSRLAEQAASGSPLFVVGPSGAGKSSLLRAGMIPRLTGSRPPGGGREPVPVLVSRPGAHPMAALDAALAAGGNRRPGGRLVVVVDQFEEIFTQCRDEDERARFAAALLALAAAPPGAGPGETPRALVVLGLRADFYADCARIPELAALLPGNQLLVGPMAEPDLRRAITGPAAAGGWAVEPGLTDLMLADLGVRPGAGDYEAGALPLLAYALRATWVRRAGTTLTVAGYREAGGIHGAIAAEAERLYTGFPAGTEETARRLVLRLVSLGPGSRAVRRRVPRAGLLAGLDRDAAEDVLARLTQARLITTDADGVEISHEALLAAWPRLRDWIADNQAGLRLHRQLAEDAESWAGEQRDPGGLYRGARLASALAWQQTAGNDAELTALEREFLTASAAEEQAQAAAREARRLRERRQNRRLRTLAAGLAVVLAAAVAAAGAAIGQGQRALAQRNLALSSSYAAQSDNDQAANLTAADLEALASWQSDHTPRSLGTLLSREADPYLGSFPEPPGSVTTALAISPDSRLLALGEAADSLGKAPAVQLWDLASRRRLATFTGLGGFVYSLSFSPDGHTLSAVTGGNGRDLWLWDVARRRVLPNPVPERPGTVSAAAYSPDGRALAVAVYRPLRRRGSYLVSPACTCAIDLWSLPGHRLLRRLTGDGLHIQSVAFSPDGRLIASGDWHSALHLWDVATGRPRAVLTGQRGVNRVLGFSPDGTYLASAGTDDTVWLWRVATGSRYMTIYKTHLTVGPIPFAFSPDGRHLFTAPGNDDINRWDLATKSLSDSVLALPGPQDAAVTGLTLSPDGKTLVTGIFGGAPMTFDESRVFYGTDSSSLLPVAVSPSGRQAASGSADGAVQLWSTADPAADRVLFSGRSVVFSLAFSPDGQRLAAMDGTCTARVWQPRTGAPPAIFAAPGAGLGPSVTVLNASVAFSPGGTVLASYCSGQSDGVAHSIAVLWDTATGRPIAAFRPPRPASVTALSYRPRGHTVALGTNAGAVLLWDTGTRRVAGTIKTGRGAVTAVAYSPGGRLLATASATGTVALWDVATHALVSHRQAGTEIRQLAFSRDGTILAGSGQDSFIRAWHVTDLAQLTSWSPSPSAGGAVEKANGLAFGTGRTLVSADINGTAHVWDLRPAAAVRRICTALGPAMVARAWRQFSPPPGPDPCPPR